MPVITTMQGQVILLKILYFANFSRYVHNIEWSYPCESCSQNTTLRYSLMDNNTVLRIKDTRTHDSGQYRIQIIRGNRVQDSTYIQLNVLGLSDNYSWLL